MQPLVERHDFRQTQTAFTTLTLADGAGGLFSSKLPLFGAPWELPLEFPLFQYVASIAYRVFDLNIDFANRITSLSFFCLCLFPLHSIARRYLTRFGSLLTCVLFSFSPFAIQWSRASLIEYCVVYFGLLFVSFALRFWDQPSWKLAIITAACGATTGLIKVTTLLPMVVFLLLLVLNKKELVLEIKRNKNKILGSIGILISVFFATQLWANFSDHIRASNPATQWLTQSRLNLWNFGTFQQRQQYGNWKLIFDRIDQLIAPPSTVIVCLVIGLAFKKTRRLSASALVAAVVAIGVFFNLYIVHDYYLIAVSCMFAFIVAAAIDAVWATVKIQRIKFSGWLIIPISLVGLLVIDGKSYWSTAYTKYPRGESELGMLSRPDQQAFVSWGGWNPLVLYYANRKGMMLTPQAVTVDYLRTLPDLEKYDFYAGNPDWPDVMTMRGWYTPVGQYLTRIDNRPEDLNEFGMAFSTMPVDDSYKFKNLKTLQCAGVDSLDLRKIPAGTSIKISSAGSNYFSVSQNLQSVPVGQSLKIFSEIPLNNSAKLTCGGGGVIDLEW